MNYTKIIYIISSLFLLTGCSGIDLNKKLSSDVQSMQGRIEQLSNDVQSLQSDMQITKEEANRANQRLDNQVLKYKK
ncbi:murein lipoprotein [Candidatus Riesia sp. GBBU]|nr:murein lipoprotein [Candidatus Riesia sp. GBBU]